MSAERYYVLFRSSFRYKSALNISHETIDKQRTLCGRKVSDAETFEPDSNDLPPDCRICARAIERIRKSSAATQTAYPEAQLKCESCAPEHQLGQLRKPCAVTGCECWCNR